MAADTPFMYWFTVGEIYDGDTIMGQLDMGLAHYLGRNPSPTYSIRLFGINAAEMNAKDPTVRAAAVSARDHLRTLIAVGDYIQVKSLHWDKYSGRIDGIPYTAAGVDCCQAQIDGGFAVPYNP
jgi:endonuclease YncB( thermonuclease family)